MFSKQELEFLFGELAVAWRYHQMAINSLEENPLNEPLQQIAMRTLEKNQIQNEEIQEKIQQLIDNTQ